MSNMTRKIGRRQSAKLKPLTRQDYNALDGETRKIIDLLRRDFAEGFAQASGMPLDKALEAVIALHERGYLTMVADEHSVGFRLCLNGKPLPGGWGFETPLSRQSRGQSS
jgi:hypothetical protein